MDERRYSIISDYLDTPVEAYDEVRKRIWKRELDIYGRVRIEQGEVGAGAFSSTKGSTLMGRRGWLTTAFATTLPKQEHTSAKTLFASKRGWQTLYMDTQ